MEHVSRDVSAAKYVRLSNSVLRWMVGTGIISTTRFFRLVGLAVLGSPPFYYGLYGGTVVSTDAEAYRQFARTHTLPGNYEGPYAFVTITGVILDLDPGGLRELHWHPNADEWQYVIEGQFDVSLFGSHGRYRIETLAKGEVAYIPQGYGHSIENIGSKSGRILIGLNTGGVPGD